MLNSEQEKCDFMFLTGLMIGIREENTIIKIDWMFQFIKLLKEQNYIEEAEKINDKIMIIQKSSKDVHDIAAEVGEKIAKENNLKIYEVK